MFLYTN